MSGSTAKNNLHSKFAVFILVFNCISIDVSATTCSQDFVDSYFPKIEWNFSWSGMHFGFFADETNFTAAQCICRGHDKNSRLAILESLDMWTKLSSYLLLDHRDKQFWVDATRTTDLAGNYTWGDGCPLALDSPMWITDEPGVGEWKARLKRDGNMMRLAGLNSGLKWPLCQTDSFGPGCSAESSAPATLTTATADTMGGETTPSTQVTMASSGLSTGTTRSQPTATIPSSSSRTTTTSSSSSSSSSSPSPAFSPVASSFSPYSTTTTSSSSLSSSPPSSSTTSPSSTTTTSSTTNTFSTASSSSSSPSSTTTTSSSSPSSSASSSSSTPSFPSTTTASSLPSSTSSSISFSSSSSTNPSSSSGSSSFLLPAYRCKCFKPGVSVLNATATSPELQAKLQEIQQNLTLDVASLSSTRRAKTSAEDTRVSATATGCAGVLLLVVFGVAILAMDVGQLVRAVMNSLRKRQSKATEKKKEKKNWQREATKTIP